MKRPADGWDAEEREALSPLEPELGDLQRRHADDPPLELLRAARADVLPEEVQRTAAAYLNGSDWSRQLVEGADDPGDLLTAGDEARLLRRIQAEHAAAARRARAPGWLWQAVLAVAAIVVTVGTWWVLRRAPQPSTPQPGAGTTVAEVSQPPSFVLPLDTPEIKVSAAALTYRSGDAGTSLLADLKPAFDALRQDDYATAARALSQLADRYPDAVEVPYYRGISQLFLNDVAGARASLARAAQLADDAFAADVGWYQAVADERAGRRDDARSRLRTLCAQRGPRSSASCAAELKIR
jgi:hypothetical protein